MSTDYYSKESRFKRYTKSERFSNNCIEYKDNKRSEIGKFKYEKLKKLE